MTKRDPKRSKRTAVKKDFDCVEMKNRIQAEIYQEIKDLTREQELEYWRKGAEQGWMGAWWRRVHKAAATKTKASKTSIRRKRST
jgi:hypothetical protein